MNYLFLVIAIIIIIFAYFLYKVPINDISTDLENPLQFYEKDSKFPTKSKIYQPKYHREVKSLVLESTDEKSVFESLKSVIKKMERIEIVKIDDEEKKLQFIETTKIFRWKDDAIFWVHKSKDSYSVLVDARSKSRVGKSDLGVNAKRIMRIFGELKKDLEKSKKTD